MREFKAPALEFMEEWMWQIVLAPPPEEGGTQVGNGRAAVARAGEPQDLPGQWAREGVQEGAGGGSADSRGHSYHSRVLSQCAKVP